MQVGIGIVVGVFVFAALLYALDYMEDSKTDKVEPGTDSNGNGNNTDSGEDRPPPWRLT